MRQFYRAALTPPRYTPAQLVLLVIVAGTIVRLICARFIGLGYGEAYYFACALDPQWSYFDQPPLGLWMGWLGMKVTGAVGPLSLRWPFIAMFAGTTWLMFAIGRRLFGDWPGFYAALLLNLSAVFTLSVGSWLQPDGPLMFFCLACVYCLVRLLFDAGLQRVMLWWLGVGVTLGLAMLSKYHAVFFVFGAGMFVLLSPRQWRWLRHPGPYVAMLIAAAVFAPVLVWNVEHEWISFLWQGKRAGYAGLRWDWLLRSISGQALWLLPWIWVPLVVELGRCAWRGLHVAGRRLSRHDAADTRHVDDDARHLLFWLAIGPVAAFTLVALWAPLGLHFHWQAPGYLVLFLALGATVHHLLQRRGPWRRAVQWWLSLSIVFTLAAIAMLTSHAATGWWRSVGPQWLSTKAGESSDPTLESLDYTPLRAALTARDRLRPDLFYVTNRWFQSGKVAYELQGQHAVFCFSPDARSWAFITDSSRWLGRDAVLIGTDGFLHDPRGELGGYFESITPIGHVAVTRGPYVEITLRLYYCKRLKKPYANPYR
ncbi:MAG: glycosyltransferase family 39 protein [Phycisphaeraceae bacterium]